MHDHDDTLPPLTALERLLQPPPLDSEGRIADKNSLYYGMTPEEVLAGRDAYNRACGE